MEMVSKPAARTSEDMFLAWFFSLPVHIDVADAARAEIARLDGVASSTQSERLRSLLVQATFPPLPPQRRRRQRH